MRTLPIVVGLLVALTSIADARGPRERAARSKHEPARSHHQVKRGKRDRDVAARERDDDRTRERRRRRGQSFGVPWNGHLEHATKLKIHKVGKGAYIRRPHRAYGTRTAVDFTRRVIEETIELYPNKLHVLSIGDMSAEHGGQVSDHHSHQSGRDIDIGLFYKHPPKGHPNAFIPGTKKNLNAAAMFTMLSKFASTAKKDGGVQVIFLDYQVQKIIYDWAKQHGVSESRLDRIFQYPHGPHSRHGIVHHYRNHAHHIHVRFQCAEADRGCD